MIGDSRYILREPTSEELKQARKEHASSWAYGLTVDQYLSREEHICSQELTGDGKMRFWVLTDASDPSKILCSCEYIPKSAVVRTRCEDVQTREVKSPVIGSVFTPQTNRGNGYASLMIKMLAQKLKAECEFDALYSDIGTSFYARDGWKPYSSKHITLPPAPDYAPQPRATLLEAADLSVLCKRDCQNIIRAFRATPLPGPIDVRLAYLPTHEVMKWHHAREDYVGEHLRRGTPLIKGAIAPSERRWCIWTRTFNGLDPSAQKLTILRIADWNIGGEASDGVSEAGKEEEIQLLLEAAQEQARLWDMKEVMIWNPTERVVNAACRILGRQVEIVERKTDCIPSLRWNGKEGLDARIQWDLNEKFAWC